jgi:hypothetical protein
MALNNTKAQVDFKALVHLIHPWILDTVGFGSHSGLGGFARGCIFSRVLPFCEQPVSDLDRPCE